MRRDPELPQIADIHRLELLGVQRLVPTLPHERLAVSVLPRAARLNEQRPHAQPRQPHRHRPRAGRKLVTVGAKVVKHSRYVIFQLAEVAVPRELFAAILGRIQRLAPAPT